MKKFLKIVAGIAGVIALGVAAVFYFTADAVTSADEFFQAVKNKDMDSAYSHLSSDFQANTSQAELESFLKRTRLDTFVEASWSSRSVSGGRGVLVGTITTRDGGTIPLTVNLVKGGGGWKIYSLSKPPSGIQEQDTNVDIPTEQEQISLVAEAMQVFAVSVNEKSMAKLHGHISNLWREQFSIEQLDEAFSSFYDFGADLTVLENFSPQFTQKPQLDENNVLVIKGLYSTTPQQVFFEHKYIFEGLGWKLIGLSVNVQ